MLSQTRLLPPPLPSVLLPADSSNAVRARVLLLQRCRDLPPFAARKVLDGPAPLYAHLKNIRITLRVLVQPNRLWAPPSSSRQARV